MSNVTAYNIGMQLMFYYLSSFKGKITLKRKFCINIVIVTFYYEIIGSTSSSAVIILRTATTELKSISNISELEYWNKINKSRLWVMHFLVYRSKASTGLWLGILVGLSAAVTILKEENSYSEICLFVGSTGFSLILCSFCLYIRLSMQQVIAKDFQAIYFLPAIVTSMYLLAANKGMSIRRLSLNNLLTVPWSRIFLANSFSCLSRL